MERNKGNCPDLNEYFDEFDVYDGRIFELWEIHDILRYDNAFSRANILALCEENQ